MGHRFVILRNDILETYDKYEDIPESFDNVIEFFVDVPPGPHTHEQHEEIDSWGDKLKELMKRQTR